MVDKSTLASKLQGTILVAGDSGYDDSLKRWAENSERKAGFVVLCENASDISHAVKWAAENSLDLAIRGGGHSCSGASSTNGGVVVDLSRMRKVTVDPERQLIYSEGGALWSDLDKEAAVYGLATVGGTINHTGVGGLTLSGGLGHLSGQYGLTVDNLVEVEIILANGEIVKANESVNPSLFWGIRGGGSNFGVVSVFVLRGYKHDYPVWAGSLIFPAEKATEIALTIEKYWKTATPKESMQMAVALSPPAFKPMIALGVFYDGPEDVGRERFEKFYKLHPMMDLTSVLPYEKVNGIRNAAAPHGGRKYMKAVVFHKISPALIQLVIARQQDLVSKLGDGIVKTAVTFDIFNSKKINSVPLDATSTSIRGNEAGAVLIPTWAKAEDDHVVKQWVKEVVEEIRDLEAKESGIEKEEIALSIGSAALGDEKSVEVFQKNYPKLQEVKKQYDPSELFNKWFPIRPAL